MESRQSSVVRLVREIAYLGQRSRSLKGAEYYASNIESSMIEDTTGSHCSSACRTMLEESSAGLLTGQETFSNDSSTKAPCISAPTCIGESLSSGQSSSGNASHL